MFGGMMPVILVQPMAEKYAALVQYYKPHWYITVNAALSMLYRELAIRLAAKLITARRSGLILLEEVRSQIA
jgi:hypothetical protein